MKISETPKPPYYAVIFTSTRTEVVDGYEQTSMRMEELAKMQEGFLGIESARNEVGITVSYWKNLQAIKNWKANEEHLLAQEKGKDTWYKNYTSRICKVEMEYGK